MVQRFKILACPAGDEGSTPSITAIFKKKYDIKENLMPSKLTYNQLENIIYINSLNTCHYISGYNGKKSKVIVKCEIHNYEFETKFENLRRASRPHHVCPHCKQSDRDSTKITSTCDFCNKEYFIRKGKMNNKTGFNFCCRKCKDSAQALVSGYSFQSLRPPHYSLSLLDSYDYRKKSSCILPK